MNPDHELRARELDPRGVPGRRADLALARGVSEAARVRAHLDHAGERLRRSAHRPLPRPSRPLPAGGRLHERAAHRDLLGWRRHPGVDRTSGGGHHRIGTDGRGRRGRARRRGRRPRRRRERRHGRHELRRVASSATASPSSRPTGTGTTGTASRCRWSTSRGSAPAGDRSPTPSADRWRSVPSRPAASPGPVCYGRGGTRPTVTDADLILGRLDPASFWGGRLTLDEAGAREAMTLLGKELFQLGETTVEETAAAVERHRRRPHDRRGAPPALPRGCRPAPARPRGLRRHGRRPRDDAGRRTRDASGC